MGGRKFGLTVQKPAQIQKARLTSRQAHTFRNLATYISFIIWVTQQSTNFLRASPKKIENLISGDSNKRGAGKFFNLRVRIIQDSRFINTMLWINFCNIDAMFTGLLDFLFVL